MARKAQQAQAEEQEDERGSNVRITRISDVTRTPLDIALAADPWDRTEEQRRLIIQADADVRLASMTEDQRKLRERPL